jgi:uncharacterized membrane protein
MKDKKDFPLSKNNFILIGVSLVLILTGFLLMTGGATMQEFNPDIFSTRRITVGPMVSFAGFLLMIVAILWKKSKNKAE